MKQEIVAKGDKFTTTDGYCLEITEVAQGGAWVRVAYQKMGTVGNIRTARLPLPLDPAIFTRKES